MQSSSPRRDKDVSSWDWLDFKLRVPTRLGRTNEISVGAVLASAALMVLVLALAGAIGLMATRCQGAP